MLYLIPTIDFDLSLVKDNAAYGVSLLILQINQVFSITENYGANLTVIGRWSDFVICITATFGLSAIDFLFLRYVFYYPLIKQWIV